MIYLLHWLCQENETGYGAALELISKEVGGSFKEREFS